MNNKESFIEMNKKNFKSITEANKIALEFLDSAREIQSKYIREITDNFANITEDCQSKPINQEYLEKTQEIIYKTVEHNYKIAEEISKKGVDFHNIAKKRFYNLFNVCKNNK